jgi:hypothetical protein
MIVVCEPQCTGASHEKVNSGFLTLLRRAYPDDDIRLYADASHAGALRSILAHDGVAIDRIEVRDYSVRAPYGVRGALSHYRQLRRILDDATSAGCERVLFLSSTPLMLQMLKRLHRSAFRHMHFAFVLHADFEDIANDRYRPVATTAVAESTLFEKLRTIRLTELPVKASRLVARKISSRYAMAWQTRFRMREQLEWGDHDGISYIALSPHVVANAAAYIDVDALHVRAVEMPINFAPISSPPANPHLKLATFGYGDPAALRRIVEQLDRASLAQPYEIRIIGMDNRGLEHHPHVYCPSPGVPLSRADMERHAADIDAFLILYDRNRYRLSCSGAILEALSYVKPVLHIGNPCVDAFDRPEAPIGFRSETLEELAGVVAAMITDYRGYGPAFDERRANILRARTRLGMENLAPKLRAVFTCDTTRP